MLGNSKTFFFLHGCDDLEWPGKESFSPGKPENWKFDWTKTALAGS
jgi:hypothetical protein